MSVIYAEHLNGKKKLQVVLFPPLLHDHIIHHRHHMSSLFSALKNSIHKKGFGQGTEGTKLILALSHGEGTGRREQISEAP